MVLERHVLYVETWGYGKHTAADIYAAQEDGYYAVRRQ
jgi:hypothetical protein